MKILTIHADYIKILPKEKAIKSAEPFDKKEIEVKECLVVFTAVEKRDQPNLDEISKKLTDEILLITEQVKTKSVVLYPYAHLSSDLANPEFAGDVLKKTETLLKKKCKVTHAPFGWYKAFEIKCKGHPLSELSREIILNSEIKPKQIEKQIDSSKLLKEIARSKVDTTNLKENDHRIIGQKLDLFSFNEVAPGMVLWHNNGFIIYNALVDYWREEHRKAKYQEVKTPQIMDSKLWKVSGHWDKYKENNFTTLYEERPFLIKPMNCPGGMLVYKANTRSYKDFPLRLSEMGVVHRTELSGVLSGMFRVIQFTQDDAHIFCSDEKQAEQEIINVAEMVMAFYKKFNLEFDHVELCTRPEKRIGTDKNWDSAEHLLEIALKKIKIKYIIKKGDGAFYGPKIDFHVKDSLGRTWQLSTIQLDFSLPERFELEYIGNDGKPHRPIMLHRVIYGSLERFIAILLEHTKGALPFWLSPIQVRVINFTDRNTESCQKLIQDLQSEIPSLRIDADFRQSIVNDKIRDSEMQKIPYTIVLGDKEEQNHTLAIRARGAKPVFGIKKETFVKELKEKILHRN